MLKKILLILVIFSLLITNLLCLASCNDDEESPEAPPVKPSDPVIGDGDDPLKPAPTVIVPTFKDYGRGSVDFDKLTYTRPDITGLIRLFSDITDKISSEKESFDALVAMLDEAEELYENTLSMHTLAQIYSYKDTKDEIWSAELAFLSSNLPSVYSAAEKTMVAAAVSSYASRFENEYFGEGFIDKYSDGGIYTDTVLSLMSEEARLESEYSSISTANTEITYKGKTAVVDDFLSEAEEKYKNDSQKLESYRILYLNYYYYAALSRAKSIFSELVRTRILLAEELGLESYQEYAYQALGHSYSAADTEKMMSAVSKYIATVYPELKAYVFDRHVKETPDTKLDRVTLINTLYEVYSDADLRDAYSYMLQHGLYDIREGDDRYSGAFTAYIETNSSPFLFATLNGYSKDYLTVAHEFGHFYDAFTNMGLGGSIDVAEISSEALELLTVLLLDGKVENEQHQYLKVEVIYKAVESLLYQSFVAKFEHLVYSLDADEVTPEKINSLVREASLYIYGEAKYSDGAEVIMMHTMLYPFYVQSYASSLIPSLEIFFTENEAHTEGLKIYKKLISEGLGAGSFSEGLELSGLSSPFNEASVKKIANSLYSYLTGKGDKFKDSTSSSGEAAS